MGNSQSLRVIIWAAVSTEAQAADDRASLPAQVADARAWAAAHGHVVVDELIVPGFSRRYYNLPEFAAALRRETDNDAGERLLRYIRERAFDVFACRDADRFGREQSLVSEVIARIIDSGARIYTLNEGWIDAQHYRMVSALTGIRAASYVDDLRRKNAMGMDKRARNGLPVTTHIPITHRRVRNDKGKTIGLELNPEARALVDALTTMYLEGMSYLNIALQLNAMGFRTIKGGLYTARAITLILHNPISWGHVMRKYERTQSKRTIRTRQWLFDDTAAPPDDAIVTRDAVPATWTGETAKRVKAEMIRRSQVKGRGSGTRTYRFAQIAICGKCGGTLSVLYSHGRRIGLRCSNGYMRKFPDDPPCAGTNRHTRDFAIVAALEHLLKPLLDGTPDDVFTTPLDNQADDSAARLDALTAQITTIDAQIDILIYEQRIASPALLENYRRQISALVNQRDALQATRDDLEAASRANREHAQAIQYTVAELRALTLPTLWTLPDREINALLRAILGNARLVFVGNECVGIKPHRGN